jgi:cytochrome c oxidase subunit 2
VEDRQHRQIARWESRWLALSGLMSLTFVLLIAYNLATEGAHIAQRTSKAHPDQIVAQPVFAEPGVRALAPGRVQVTQVAQAFAFQPSDVRVPVGADVEFYLTARDVIHGYQIERTNVNVELIPGEVARLHYTFKEPGVYRVTCNEYCGIGHHTMLGTVTVVPASQWREDRATAAQADGEVDGEAVYAANCASCHQANGQGVAGAFPPVAGHSAALIAEQGRDYLPLLLLYGLQGPIQVGGTTYNGQMPAWQQLSDEELAAVTNYMVTTWDEGELPGDFEPYTPDEFAEARGQGLTADDVYERRSE